MAGPLKLAFALVHVAALAGVAAQQIGTAVPEVHPELPTEFCTVADGCKVRKTKVVADVTAHPMHVRGNESIPCTAAFGTDACKDAASCTRNCVIEGADYAGMGVSTNGNAMELRMYMFNGTDYKKVSPRVYLLAEDARNYEVMRLVNMELSYDVDVSQLGCGMNGALYFSEMDASGSRSDLNPAGATYGTGVCDAQCFQDQNFTNGVANLQSPAPGACCNEMDIWEANRMATAMTPHTCSKPSSFRCTGDECGSGPAGVCDKSGCQINPYRLGDKEFYGPNKTVNTERRFTVVTQFVHENAAARGGDVAAAGPLREIRRKYIQDGRVLEDVRTDNATLNPLRAMNQAYCDAQGPEPFNRLGGLAGTGQAMARGMVLIFSIWNSDGDFMSWLDASGKNGKANGPCGPNDGDPKRILQDNPKVSVTFSNIKWGELNTTFSSNGKPAQGKQAGGTPPQQGKSTASSAAPAFLMASYERGSILGIVLFLGALLSLM